MQAQWKKGYTLSRSRDSPGRDGKPLDSQRGEASCDSHDNEPPRHPLKSLSSRPIQPSVANATLGTLLHHGCDGITGLILVKSAP
ncbi:MAG: hypothetical protein RLZZ616_2680 [Pseudomonadota bacterium]